MGAREKPFPARIVIVISIIYYLYCYSAHTKYLPTQFLLNIVEEPLILSEVSIVGQFNAVQNHPNYQWYTFSQAPSHLYFYQFGVLNLFESRVDQFLAITFISQSLLKGRHDDPEFEFPFLAAIFALNHVTASGGIFTA